MKKLVSLLLALTLGAGILSGCQPAVVAAGSALLVGSISSNEKSGISQATGIDVTDGEMVSLESETGFHGDGTSITVIRFSDDTALRQIEDAANREMEEICRFNLYAGEDLLTLTLLGVPLSFTVPETVTEALLGYLA